MNLKNNNKGARMKYLILSLMVFGSFQAFSKECNITNYRDFIFSEEAIDELIKNTGAGCNLSGVDFKEAELSRADFRYANLSGANFQWAYLDGANLYMADLSGANLNANFGSIVVRDKVYKTNLTGAYLKGASIPWTYKEWLTKNQQNQVGEFVEPTRKPIPPV